LWHIDKQEKKCACKYSAVINILCDVIADVVDVIMKTRPLTSDDRACVASWERTGSAAELNPADYLM